MNPDTYFTSAAPTTAIRIWREGCDLLVEFPSKEGHPYIMRIAPSMDAIAKVVDLVLGTQKAPMVRRGLTEQSSLRAQPGHIARHPLLNKPSPQTKGATDEQRANARAVLKRMGIT